MTQIKPTETSLKQLLAGQNSLTDMENLDLAFTWGQLDAIFNPGVVSEAEAKERHDKLLELGFQTVELKQLWQKLEAEKQHRQEMNGPMQCSIKQV